MWPDTETTRDFLNFTGVAKAIANIITNSQGHPVSIGVSGSWGTGKSTMIQLIKSELSRGLEKTEPSPFIFIEFNAWLYQGYDDARAALLETIAQTLEHEANERKTALSAATSLIRRINWFRIAKIGAGTALPLAFGLPPIGPLGELITATLKFTNNNAGPKEAETVKKAASETESEFRDLLRAPEQSSPLKEIHALRKAFEETLRELKATLVVFVDDLDRCLPPTTISTLEAIRHFLFMDKAAFVIAADTEMIRHAVSKHFEGLSDQSIVTSYFDKLIQVPLRVPPLGTQEVRAYMYLLFAEHAGLQASVRESLRQAICEQLARSWRGERINQDFVTRTLKNIPSKLLPQLEIADRLAPIMTRSTAISGNPRLIKRFLNALSIRTSLAQTHGVDVDEAVLAKLLLLERLGNPDTYRELVRSVTEDFEGKARFLTELEENARAGAIKEIPAPWNEHFVVEWLALPPLLGDRDLRGALYIGREHTPIISTEDSLTSEGLRLFEGMIESPQSSASFIDELKALPAQDRALILSRLLDMARQEKEWGTPAILDACLSLCEADPSQGPRLAAMLRERPTHQIKPDLIPKLDGHPWAQELFDYWENAGVSKTVSNAIRAQRS